MPENIYDLLARHFLGQTNVNENQLIQDYQRQNPEEYTRLKTLFESKKVSIKNFDSHIAWQKVQSEYELRKASATKTVPMYVTLTRIAAAIAFFIVVAWGGYNLLKPLSADTPLQITVGGDSQEKISLPDGTVVWLNNSASLTFPERFERGKRTVILKGEAFFEVTRVEDMPFSISTPDVTVTVLGTSFNVKALEETMVTVATGKVKVETKSTTQKVIINAGESAQIENGKLTAFNTVDPNYRSWQTGAFTFSQAPLSQVVSMLNTYYQNKFSITPQQSSCTLTATFNKASLEEIAEVLRLTCNVSVLKNAAGLYEIR